MIIWQKVKKDYFFNNNSDQFNSKKWLSIISKRVKLNFGVLKKSNYLNQFISTSPLPIMLLGETKRKIRIADFGSGSQELFFQLSLMKLKKNIEVDSIEVEKLIKSFKKNKKFKNKEIKINFLKELNFKRIYDYVHISDSLQYVDNWRVFLKKINMKNHKYLILNNIAAGKNKTYITKQAFYGEEIKNIFFSIDEISKILNSYKLVFKTFYLNKIKGEYKPYPQNNFKKKDRIGYPKTLIFKKK